MPQDRSFNKKLSLEGGSEVRSQEKAPITHPGVELHESGISWQGSGMSELPYRAPSNVTPPGQGVPPVPPGLRAAEQGFRISFTKQFT